MDLTHLVDLMAQKLTAPEGSRSPIPLVNTVSPAVGTMFDFFCSGAGLLAFCCCSSNKCLLVWLVSMVNTSTSAATRVARTRTTSNWHRARGQDRCSRPIMTVLPSSQQSCSLRACRTRRKGYQHTPVCIGCAKTESLCFGIYAKSVYWICCFFLKYYTGRQLHDITDDVF